MTVPLSCATELVERAPCGLLTAGAGGIILRINATMCGWLGVAPEELLGKKSLADLFTVGTRVFYQTHCLPMLQVQGSVAEIQVDVPHSDGTRIPGAIDLKALEGKFEVEFPDRMLRKRVFESIDSIAGVIVSAVGASAYVIW